MRRRARFTAIVMTGGIAIAAALPAQQPSNAARVMPPGGQLIDRDGRNLTGAPQVRPATQASVAATQLAPAGAAREQAEQLDHDARDARTRQVYRGGRTAQPSTPLSTPAQGRRVATTRLTGHDRCDPSTPPDKRVPGCERTIETRSAEFARSSPLRLSPEQRLLVDQRLRDAPATAEASVARVGRNKVEPDAADTQTLAALVLPAERPVEKPARTDTGDLSAINPTGALADAIVQSVVEGAQTGTPRR